MINLEEVFQKYDYEWLHFDSVKEKLHPRPDICAFLLLDKLVPNPNRDMISSAEHDEIFLDTDCDELAAAATEEDIITLIRCGVLYEHRGLCMFA